MDVTIVTVGAGVSYGNQGYTHHALQDYALMRSFPNIKIIAPGDSKELERGMDYIFQNKLILKFGCKCILFFNIQIKILLIVSDYYYCNNHR
jgi:transketolase